MSMDALDFLVIGGLIGVVIAGIAFTFVFRIIWRMHRCNLGVQPSGVDWDAILPRGGGGTCVHPPPPPRGDNPRRSIPVPREPRSIRE